MVLRPSATFFTFLRWAKAPVPVLEVWICNSVQPESPVASIPFLMIVSGLSKAETWDTENTSRSKDKQKMEIFFLQFIKRPVMAASGYCFFKSDLYTIAAKERCVYRGFSFCAWLNTRMRFSCFELSDTYYY